MAIDEIVAESKVNLTPGNVYGIRLDGYTFEGTYEGTDGQSIILRTGRKSNSNGTIRLFDRQELPIRIANKAYSL